MATTSPSTDRPPAATATGHAAGTWYFLTLIVQGRAPILGAVQAGKLALTPMGLEVARAWRYGAAIRREIHLGPWMVMPDHFHALVRVPPGPTPAGAAAPRSRRLFQPPRIAGPLGSLIAGFKMGSTREVNRLRGTPRARLWRKGVLYRRVEDEVVLESTARFILDNPRQWIAQHP
jgi:hypothetical protein